MAGGGKGGGGVYQKPKGRPAVTSLPWELD